MVQAVRPFASEGPPMSTRAPMCLSRVWLPPLFRIGYRAFCPRCGDVLRVTAEPGGRADKRFKVRHVRSTR